MSDRSTFNYRLGLELARLEDPVARFDRLVLDRTIQPTMHGYGMWCYHCKSIVVASPFVATPDWFDAIAHNYLEHVGLCCPTPS